MKLIFRNLNEARKNKERNIGKVFSYDEKFLNSLQKPGKTTFIRFSNEMPGGGLMLTPNFSSYTHENSPVGIYGYPLDLVKTKLLDQSLDFSHYKFIIVYWVNSDTIINLNSITKEDLVDLIDQIVSYGGKEKYIESIQKWKKTSEASHRDIGKRLETAERIAGNILYRDGSVSHLSDRDAPLAFVGIIRYYGDKATSKTLLLSKLRLKQKDNEGNIVEKSFSTILDQSNLLDPLKGGSEIQALTLSSKSVEDYEFFENPVARSQSKKPPPESVSNIQNPLLFDKFKATYLDQLGTSVKNLINSNAVFEFTPGGVLVELKLAGKKSLVEEFLLNPKNNKVNKQKLVEAIPYDIGEFLKGKNNQTAYGSRTSWSIDYNRPGIKTLNTGDVYTIKAIPPAGIIEARGAYSLIYFVYLIFKPIEGAKKDPSNPFTNTTAYNAIIKNAARFAV